MSSEVDIARALVMGDLEYDRTKVIEVPITGGGPAPAAAQYVVIALNATLSAERVLTGTSNQIVITDNGANSTVVISTPQNIHTAATPTFASLTLSGLTAGRVVFAGAAGLLTDDAGFTFDNITLSLTDSNADTTPLVIVTQSSTGDAAQRFVLGSTISYIVGIDNSVAGDPFKISTAASATAVLGTNDLVQLTTDPTFTAVVSSAATAPGLEVTQASTGDAAARFALGSTISYIVGIDNSDSDVLKIATAASASAALGTSDLLVLDSTGRLGLGNNGSTFRTASTYIQISSDGTPTDMTIITNSSTATDSPTILNRRARGTLASTLVVVSGDRLGLLGFQGMGSDGGSYVPAAQIRAEVDGTPGVNDMPGRLVFATTANGASTATERMRIDNQGNVMIGVSAVGTSAAKLLGMGGATAPTTNPADMFQIYDLDLVAGLRWPFFEPENGTAYAIMGNAGDTGVSSGTGTIKMAGSTSRNSAGWITSHDFSGNVRYIPYFQTITG